MNEIFLFLAGGLVSWLVAMYYYRQSNTKMPEWFLPLIDKLPEKQPKNEELLKLFQESLDTGDINYNELTGTVACPECNLPSSDFKTKVFGDDIHTIVDVSCPSCGWSKSVEV